MLCMKFGTEIAHSIIKTMKMAIFSVMMSLIMTPTVKIYTKTGKKNLPVKTYAKTGRKLLFLAKFNPNVYKLMF